MGVSSEKRNKVETAIPTRQRELVKARSAGLCERCKGRASDVHHRQRRREGGHGIENLVHLCRTCHSWAHANPGSAVEEGFIVGTFIKREDIHGVPIIQFGREIYLSTTGGYVGSPTINEEE